MIAISHFIARRIWKVYRREAAVIYPPVDVSAFSLRVEGRLLSHGIAHGAL
jgi:hypothetical protein